MTPSEFIAIFRKRIEDDEAPYENSDIAIVGWINAALKLINRERPFIRSTGYIVPDGTAYSWTLNDTDDTALISMTNFSVLRYVRIDVAVNKPVLRRAKTNMIYIRDREATNSIYSGYPTFYGIDGKFILYLDAKMAAPAPAPAAAPDDDAADAPDDAAAPADALAILDSEKIWIDFWKIPSEFNDLDGAPVAAVDTLQGDIASGWDAMILAATELEASPDIGGDIGIKLEAHGSRVYYDEFLPNSRVKNPNSIHAFKEYVLKTEVDGYQENRSPVSSLGLDDDKEFYVAEDYDPGFTTE